MMQALGKDFRDLTPKEVQTGRNILIDKMVHRYQDGSVFLADGELVGNLNFILTAAAAQKWLHEAARVDR